MKRNILLAFLLIGLVVMEWGCKENENLKLDEVETPIRTPRIYIGNFTSINTTIVIDSLGEGNYKSDTTSGMDTVYFKYSNDTVWVTLTNFQYRDTFSSTPLKDYIARNGTFVKWNLGFEIVDSTISVWSNPYRTGKTFRFNGKEI